MQKSYYEPVYLIGAVAEILNIHPQTLRQYEREGLIKPSRTNGRIRLYSQHDIDNIKIVLSLTRDLGINLAGVELILELKEQIVVLQEELEFYKKRLKNVDKFGVVPSHKALVVKKSLYDIVIFEE
ncbi:MAG: heat shock protein transcriptional repressor HspR [Arcobacteraceae bacterium]|jgi:MerR family transcriptional regulator/heat shock protein HspR|nr:helix-turn-helix transcriptional regulator [Arcobacteraceae bacterium]